MTVVRRLATAVLALGTGLAFAPAALAAPAAFTSKGSATSYQDGQAVKIPNTLYYKQGHIRLEMSPPASANPDGGPVFSVVLAQEGSDTITLLNPQERQAMRLPASTLEAVTANASLQKVSKFNLSEFGKTFRAQGKKVGAEAVAGEPCTVLEQKGKDGHFKLWLSDKHEIPLKFQYFEGGKPAFDYEVQQFSPSAGVSDASFAVPAGYQTIDMGEMLNGHQ
jgi:Domain of unknown function (DUF4412)